MNLVQAEYLHFPTVYVEHLIKNPEWKIIHDQNDTQILWYA